MIRAGCTLVAAAVTLGLAAAIKVVRDSRSWRAWDDDDGGPETIEGQLIPMAAWNGYVGNWPATCPTAYYPAGTSFSYTIGGRP